MNKIELPDAAQVVIDAMKKDDDYAWSWHCCIAVSIQDEGVDHATANRAAGRFMELLIGRNTNRFSEDHQNVYS